MNNVRRYLAAILRYTKQFFTSNLVIKIIALVFAMLAWGVMLLEVKPVKQKSFSDVPVTVEGEADLHARNLVIRGDIKELLDDVSVRVSSPVTSIMDLNMSSISASVNLRNVTTPGTAVLTVNATVPARLGTIDSDGISPSRIEVEIDTLLTRTVPVEVVYSGRQPAGYWAGRAELSNTMVEIRGPKQDVERVTKAICQIQMTDRTQSYNDAVALKLVNEEGVEVPSHLFLDGAPIVMVRMPVQPKKTVPVDVEGALRGSDNIPTNFELISATATPAMLDITGSVEVLTQVQSIALEGIDISGKTESVHENLRYQLPEGVEVIRGGNADDTVEVFIDIREKTLQKSFQDIPIEVRGLEHGYTATLASETLDIDIQGRITLVEALERADAKAYVDLAGLKEGNYSMNVRVLLEDDATTLELTCVQSIAQVIVNVKKA